MAHREDIRAYLESLTVSGEVIDWGCGAKPVQKYVQGKANFHTIDSNSSVSPNVVADITEPIYMTQADHAFCMEVLEHVLYPQKVIDNIYSNLKKGGILHLSVPFMFPKHGEEDYWRFTDRGLIHLARKFQRAKVWEITDGYLMEAVK